MTDKLLFITDTYKDLNLKKDTSNLTEKIKKKISELLEKNNLNSATLTLIFFIYQ